MSLVPFGIGRRKPHHFADMARVAWENRGSWGYAWRILKHGVCDGCALGPRGLKDDAIPGVHLCLTRLKMLRLNTMPALDPRSLSDAKSLRQLGNRGLRGLGRLAYPMIRRRGDGGFTRLPWDEALAIAGERLKKAAPDRAAIYTTSRGLTNETYYAAQKFARLLGTNNIDNAARLCHAASTVALKETLGVGASTCSYTDWVGTDLIVLLGSNVANNQPVATKYFHYAVKRGARIVTVNAYREPGLENYWIPSIASSALFGTRLSDTHFSVRVGGDVAFLNGVVKSLIERSLVDRAFVDAHTTGFEEMRRTIDTQPWADLERASGAPRAEMEKFAALYGSVRNAVFIWSMGLTQHRFGVENVKAVVNVALARGMIGRENVGVVPVRGHSGVQGAAEMGSVPDMFAAGIPVNADNARRMASLWGAPVPASPGLSAAEMVDACGRGEIDAFYVMGGSFVETLPDPAAVEKALARVPCRIHQDLVVNESMLADPADVVLLLPAKTRYEQEGGGTVTSTERRVRFSPEVPRQEPLGETRAEWRIVSDLARRALPPERSAKLAWKSVREIIEEIDRVIPLYEGIAGLAKEGDSFQYGGKRLLEGGACPNLPLSRARFSPLAIPNARVPEGRFALATRRGRQFNSIIWADADPLTGSRRRDDVFMSREDAARLGIGSGDPVVLRSETGEFRGVAKIDDVHPGTLQAYWPETNVLVSNRLDPASREPDYNAVVTLERA